MDTLSILYSKIVGGWGAGNNNKFRILEEISRYGAVVGVIVFMSGAYGSSGRGRKLVFC